MRLNKFFFLTIGCCLLLTACEGEPEAPDNDDDSSNSIDCPGYTSMYLLSEGGWGQNNARIDLLDFSTGTYTEDAYVKANPSTILELGDVGNQLQLNDQRLYAVINGSHKVEVMNAADLKRIGQVDINSPRYIAFTQTHGYVTSYVDNGNDNGSIVEFDLQTLQVTRTMSIGQEPEGIAIAGDKIYVAHSGGLHSPNYSDEVWVINVSNLTIADKISVAPNLNRLEIDQDGAVWVNSRGNYADVASGLYRIKDGTVESAGVPCTSFSIAGNKVYYYSSDWSSITNSYSISYGTIDRATLTPGNSFISDGTEMGITAPYGISAAGGLIFIGDAKNYASSGTLNVYDSDGKRIGQFTTGVCPSSMVFIPRN